LSALNVSRYLLIPSSNLGDSPFDGKPELWDAEASTSLLNLPDRPGGIVTGSETFVLEKRAEGRKRIFSPCPPQEHARPIPH
jgi:hypothetical protein